VSRTWWRERGRRHWAQFPLQLHWFHIPWSPNRSVCDTSLYLGSSHFETVHSLHEYMIIEFPLVAVGVDEATKYVLKPTWNGEWSYCTHKLLQKLYRKNLTIAFQNTDQRLDRHCVCGKCEIMWCHQSHNNFFLWRQVTSIFIVQLCVQYIDSGASSLNYDGQLLCLPSLDRYVGTLHITSYFTLLHSEQESLNGSHNCAWPPIPCCRKSFSFQLVRSINIWLWWVTFCWNDRLYLDAI
jgi:hypothetical protein